MKKIGFFQYILDNSDSGYIKESYNIKINKKYQFCNIKKRNKTRDIIKTLKNKILINQEIIISKNSDKNCPIRIETKKLSKRLKFNKECFNYIEKKLSKK